MLTIVDLVPAIYQCCCCLAIFTSVLTFVWVPATYQCCCPLAICSISVLTLVDWVPTTYQCCCRLTICSTSVLTLVDWVPTTYQCCCRLTICSTAVLTLVDWVPATYQCCCRLTICSTSVLTHVDWVPATYQCCCRLTICSTSVLTLVDWVPATYQRFWVPSTYQSYGCLTICSTSVLTHVDWVPSTYQHCGRLTICSTCAIFSVSGLLHPSFGGLPLTSFRVLSHTFLSVLPLPDHTSTSACKECDFVLPAWSVFVEGPCGLTGCVYWDSSTCSSAAFGCMWCLSAVCDSSSGWPPAIRNISCAYRTKCLSSKTGRRFRCWICLLYDPFFLFIFLFSGWGGGGGGGMSVLLFNIIMIGIHWGYWWNDCRNIVPSFTKYQSLVLLMILWDILSVAMELLSQNPALNISPTVFCWKKVFMVYAVTMKMILKHFHGLPCGIHLHGLLLTLWLSGTRASH